MNHTIRDYRPDDRDSIFELYEAVWGEESRRRITIRWDWEFERNPFNAERLHIGVADDSGRIVGLYATIPILFSNRGRVIRACWSVDLMTHPEYQGRGIFRSLTDRVIEDSKAAGVDVFLVFPNHNSFPIYVKMKWQQLFHVPILVRVYDPGVILAKIRKAGLKPGSLFRSAGRFLGQRFSRSGGARTRGDVSAAVRVEPVERFDEGFDDLWERVADRFDFMVVRNAEYLNWRYVDCPDKQYDAFQATDNGRTVGYVVTRTGEKDGVMHGYIIDIQTAAGRDDAAHRLVDEALGFMRGRGARIINCKMMNSGYRDILKQHGFVEADRSMCETLFGHVSPRMNADALRNFKEWMISRGDADTDICV